MKTLVPEDYSRLVRLSSLALAPDGTMAYVKYFWADNAWQRRVEIARDGKAREITMGGAVENCPAFSRDGKLLWFLSDGRAAVYDQETEEVRQAFSLPEGFAAVDLLPPKYRAVIYLYYYEGYSVREIGQITKRSETAVQTQLYRARKLLKQQLGEELEL